LSHGFAMTRNPLNPKQVSRVDLTRENVDGFVFWTKNPAPFLEHLWQLEGYAYYFQFTLTPYENDIEAGLPAKNTLVQTFRDLSGLIGKNAVIWRYDPIICSKKYDFSWHCREFAALCRLLADYTDRCVISFYRDYRFAARRMLGLGLTEISDSFRFSIAEEFSGIAGQYGISLQACAEERDLTTFKIARSRCVDASLLANIGKTTIKAAKDRGQRPFCGCDRSIDIGAYSTCLHQCLYCYAARRNLTRLQIEARHDPGSPFLVSAD
jgi:hypothetical protein